MHLGQYIIWQNVLGNYFECTRYIWGVTCLHKLKEEKETGPALTDEL